MTVTSINPAIALQLCIDTNSLHESESSAVPTHAVPTHAVSAHAVSAHAVSVHSAPAHVTPQSRDLLAGAARELLAAGVAQESESRYAHAHLAALRAAAAVLATRARPRSRRGSRVRSAWVLLADIAPEFSEWAAFFAAGASKRAAAEAGLRGVVTAREADDLVREVEQFLGLVARQLGAIHQPLLSELTMRIPAPPTRGS
jgi:hypothetical protein